jgi:hypothetical protein
MNKKVYIGYFSATALTVLFHFTLHWYKPLNKNQSIFYLDEQITTGMYLSAIGLFLAGLIFYMISEKQKDKKQKLSSMIFMSMFWFLSIDEYFELHEYANALIKKVLDIDSFAGSLVHLSWVFPFLIVLSFVIWFLMKSIINEKDKQVKLSLLLALCAAVLVLPLEVIGGSLYGNAIYVLFVGIEEGSELVAIGFFIRAGILKLNGLKDDN